MLIGSTLTGAGTRQAERERPRDGDVVITPDEREPSRYLITQVPEGPQAIWASRDQALTVARNFAQLHAVDVWIRDGSLATRTAHYRPRRRGDDHQ